MSFLCPDCPGAAIPANYSDTCELFTRTFGVSQFLLLKCNLEFTDVTDIDEWAAHIAAGDIVTSPIGNFEIGEAASEIVQTTGCGQELRDTATIPFTYETVRVEEDYADEVWYAELDMKQSGYNLAYVNCDACRLYLPYSQVQTINTPTVNVTGLGFKFSLNTIPQFVAGPGGNGKTGIWRVQGSFLSKTVLNSVEITGLCTALNPVTP